MGNSVVRLTEKESCVLFLYLRGRTSKEIAKVCLLSPRTIEDHIYAIKHKLNLHSRSEVVDFVIKHGLFNFVPNAMLKLI